MVLQEDKLQVHEVAGRGKADKRQAIIDSARELFTVEGYEETTIASVAKKAGVAVGTVYLYFKNKTELLYGIKGDWEAEFLGFLADPQLLAVPHHLRARPMIEACFAISEQHCELVQLMGVPPQMVGDLYKQSNPVEAALQLFFNEGIAAEAFRPVDTHAAAVIAYGMVHKALEQCLVIEGGQNKQRYIDALVDAFEHWIGRPELIEGRGNGEVSN